MVCYDSSTFMTAPADKKMFIRFSIIFSAIYFFSLNGLGALPNLSLSFLLKENVRLNPSQMAYFQAITLVAWVIKPLWGFISDSFPIFGYRRKSYLIITSILAGTVWLLLAATKIYTEAILLSFITICYMAYAFQDVVTDGLMVEIGKPRNLTGRFQSIQWASVYSAMIITAFCGGYISDLARNGAVRFQTIFAMTSIFPILTAFITAILVSEPKASHLEIEGKTELKAVFKQKELWFLASFLFLWNFSPSFGAPFFYYSVDTLKFNGSFLGIAQGVGSGAALVGSILSAKYVERVPMRKFLILAVFIGSVMILFNLVYFIPSVISHPSFSKSIILISQVPFGIVNTFIFLTLLNLAAKSSPQYAGGTIFALLMSFLNLGQIGSEVLGGALFSILGLKPLILISAFFSLTTLLILPYLPLDEKLTPLEQSLKKWIEKTQKA